MRITGKISKIYPQRTGVSTKTGNPYTVSEFHFTWTEGSTEANMHQAIVRCSTMQDINMERVRQAFSKFEDVQVGMVFDVRESTKQPDVYFNEVRIFLPAEFLNKKVVGPATDSMP